MAEPTEDAAFAAGSTSLGLLSQIAQVGDDAFSTMDLATALSCGGSPTQHYGPYASSSPDSSTCGNDWAQDTFDRHFTVRKTATTTFEVVEQFKSGSFATMAGPSPGGCDTNVGGTINSGVSGSMHGYLMITVTGAQTSTSPACVPAGLCTTTTFIQSHFTGSAFTIGTFFSTTVPAGRAYSTVSGRTHHAIGAAIRATLPPPAVHWDYGSRRCVRNRLAIENRIALDRGARPVTQEFLR